MKAGSGSSEFQWVGTMGLSGGQNVQTGAMAYAEAKGELDPCAGHGGQCGWSGAGQGRWW